MRSLRRGLTMIEVMIAIAIVTFVGVIGWESIETAIALNDVLELHDGTNRQARVSLGRLRRELQLAYLTPNRPGGAVANGQQAAGATAGANPVSAPVVVGDPRYLTVFVAENSDPDRLWFSTLGHQRIYHNARECDQAEVTVWAERAEREQGEGYVLYHRESQRIDGKPDEDGRIWPLAYNVKSFDLRYLDGTRNEWVDEWDTRSADTPYRLPRAVQVAMVLLAPDPEDEDDSVEVPFFTTIPLQYADPVTPKVGADLMSAGGAAGGLPGASGGLPGGMGMGGLR